MVNNSDTKVRYRGNGSNRVFPITFPFTEDDYICVRIANEETGEVREIESDFLVDNIAQTVTYPGWETGQEPPVADQPAVLTSDETITIYRKTEISQLTELGIKFPLPQIEKALDKVTNILQEHDEALERSVKVDIASEEESSYYYEKIMVASDNAVAAAATASAARDEAVAKAASMDASVAAAANEAAAAANSATAAATSAANAATSALAAADSQTASGVSAQAAANSAAQSQYYAAESETSAGNAGSQALAAQLRANNAADSAQTAAGYAQSAAGAASSCNNVLPQVLNGATNAAASAAVATSKAAEALLSANNAASSAEAAALSATTATAQASDAADSATAAASSASDAADSATAAETSNTEAKYYAKITMDKVATAAVGYPSQSGTLTYNGSSQTPTWDVFYEPNKMTVTGDTSGTNAGTYTITMTPKPGYYWWDTDTTVARTQTWTIGRQAIASVPSQSGTLVYSGAAQTPTWSNYDSTKMTIGGTTSVTAAGTYTATFTPKSNYKWSDGTTTAKNVNWTISAAQVTIPTVTNTSKTYNGSSQGPTITGLDSAKVDVQGDATATAAGSYTITFHLKSTNYTWSDGTSADKSVGWTISIMDVAIPVVEDTVLTYSGSTQGPTLTYDSNNVTVSGNSTATNVGTYTVIFSLKNASVEWSDGTTAAKSYSWSIGKKTVSVPVVTNTSKTYNTASQSPTIGTYDTNNITVGGATSGTNAGTYTITFSLTSPTNCKWSDDSTADKAASWTISPKAVEIPNVTNTTKTYSGSSQGPTISTYSATEVVQTGTSSAINAGTYTVTFGLSSTTNYKWSDNSTSNKSTNWTIGPKSVTVPTVTNTSKTYTGTSQGPTIAAYDSNEITQGGTVSAVNAGSYSVTFSLASVTNYIWSDNTTAQKSASWSIVKAAGSLSLSTNSVSLDNSTMSTTVTVTRTGDGVISAVSSDSTIATVSLSGTTLTITAVATGSATITVSVADGTNHLAPTDQTVSVDVILIRHLNEYSWAEISAIAQAGQGANYWDIGDKKEVVLNGAIGDYLTLDNFSTYVFILDFNHPINKSTAMNNIIFSGFKTSDNKDIALCDSRYDTNNISGKNFNLNHKGENSIPYNTNYGGWKGCDFRYDILGGTSTQPSPYNTNKTTGTTGYDATQSTIDFPVSNTLMAALPSDFRSVLRLWDRYVDAEGNTSKLESGIKKTVDAITLLAEWEIFGARTYANQFEQNHQVQMAYYKNGNSKIRYKHSNISTAVGWWGSSANSNNTFEWCFVYNGSVKKGNSFRSYGVAPAFLV